MCSSCGCSCSCCGCSCGCSCGDCNGSGVGGVTTPSLTQFPVYVSYPAFFASESAISNANTALFIR